MAEVNDGERRVAKRLAQLHHMEEVIAQEECEVAEQEREIADRLLSLARMREELTILRPYWGPGITKEQAIATYLAANQPVASGDPA